MTPVRQLIRGGLAGAVGPDESRDLALLHRKLTRRGRQAPEVLAEIGYFKKRVHN